ncbi:Bcr/CflA family multidrug efflux MFS transporter [Morganella psychrotolerans]|uniref:Bcr/CflA family efflux transporter n=1 Tax=Morganella psychrotolerans TaxID=368603 RepID=A0A1B8HF62_9GAMM|nr:Bcr/CflA family multidrug efflux MFS transporter [Morganella psychrotolerans]OBU07709.1 Bcr/CflA family drug resistance efflux transporter [Morganella psychrotolerans]
MQSQRSTYFGLIFILGLLSMLMPLAIDMYLPSMPTIARDFGASEGDVQMTLNSYLIGFAAGQLVYGPMADALGRKPVILGGTLIFALASAGCALSQDIDTFIGMRGLHGFAAAAASVVINALMRDMFTKDEFSRSMSFVVLVMTIAPLIAPIMGGLLMLWFSWHAIFWTIMVAALIAAILVLFFIRETLPKERRQPFRMRTMLGQFVVLFRQKQVLCYMVASGFSFAGMFSFLSAGSFVYIQLYGLTELEFGYCFALNIVFLFIMTTINSRYVRRFGALNMLRTGLVVQLIAGCWLMLAAVADLGFIAILIGVACYVGNIAMITSNAMAVILDDYPHMAGTASSLAGVLRFGIGAGVGAVVASFEMTTVWPMVGAMALCILIAASLVLYARRFA